MDGGLGIDERRSFDMSILSDDGGQSPVQAYRTAASFMNLLGIGGGVWKVHIVLGYSIAQRKHCFVSILLVASVNFFKASIKCLPHGQIQHAPSR